MKVPRKKNKYQCTINNFTSLSNAQKITSAILLQIFELAKDRGESPVLSALLFHCDFYTLLTNPGYYDGALLGRERNVAIY